MRKPLHLIPAALMLASCGTADAEPTSTPPPSPTFEEPDDGPTIYDDFPIPETIKETTNSGAGTHTITIEAATLSDGTAHWGDLGSGNVTDIPAGSSWAQTITNADPADYWTVTVMGDFVSPGGDVSCVITVDGEIVSEEVAAGQGASAFCSSVPV